MYAICTYDRNRAVLISSSIKYKVALLSHVLLNNHASHCNMVFQGEKGKICIFSSKFQIFLHDVKLADIKLVLCFFFPFQVIGSKFR